MQNRTKETLDAIQIKHWITAAKSGQLPTIKDKATGKSKPLSLPFARSDGDGLTFTLSRSGTASWVLRYRYGGRAKELTIGGYPDIGLSEARKLAREFRVKIDQGGDPASEKKQAKTQALRDWTVRQLIQDYREKILSELSASSQRSYGRSLKRMESKLGSLTVSRIVSIPAGELAELRRASYLLGRARTLALIAGKNLRLMKRILAE